MEAANRMTNMSSNCPSISDSVGRYFQTHLPINRTGKICVGRDVGGIIGQLFWRLVYKGFSGLRL
jgi:hypothetical protein